MNYFAHARVAAEVDGDAAFVLGAMLPDFAHMLGDRIDGLEHAVLRAGEQHHRRSDEVFHRTLLFQRLVRDATAALSNAGLARGPARGVAHLGVELLLDGALVGDRRSHAPYLEALEAAPGLEEAIAWRGADGRLRWQRLQARLRMSGLPYALLDPMRVTERVARALEDRPRLRIAPHERTIVQRWLGCAKAEVTRAAPELLAQTLAGIGEDG